VKQISYSHESISLARDKITSSYWSLLHQTGPKSRSK